MSGHSKWSTIKHKKAATDKKRGKVFTKHAKLIAVAARNGGDPDHNPTLRAVIDNARAENVPVDNIERAIKKGTGEGKDAAAYEEIFYEAFAPGGVALYIETLTDNRNRTISNLKTVLTKKGGNMGSAGSVGYLFQKKGRIEIDSTSRKPEDIELAAIDAGAEDIRQLEELIEVYTSPTDLMLVKGKIEDGGVKVDSASMTFIPATMIDVTDSDTAKTILALIEAIEEDEDVTTVYHNAEIHDTAILD